jgi:hypothetical protein
MRDKMVQARGVFGGEHVVTFSRQYECREIEAVQMFEELVVGLPVLQNGFLCGGYFL